MPSWSAKDLKYWFHVNRRHGYAVLTIYIKQSYYMYIPGMALQNSWNLLVLKEMQRWYKILPPNWLLTNSREGINTENKVDNYTVKPCCNEAHPGNFAILIITTVFRSSKVCLFHYTKIQHDWKMMPRNWGFTVLRNLNLGHMFLVIL